MYEHSTLGIGTEGAPIAEQWPAGPSKDHQEGGVEAPPQTNPLCINSFLSVTTLDGVHMQDALNQKVYQTNTIRHIIDIELTCQGCTHTMGELSSQSLNVGCIRL